MIFLNVENEKEIFIIHSGLIYRLFGNGHREEETWYSKHGKLSYGKTHLILSNVPKSPIGVKLDTWRTVVPLAPSSETSIVNEVHVIILVQRLIADKRRKGRKNL